MTAPTTQEDRYVVFLVPTGDGNMVERYEGTPPPFCDYEYEGPLHSDAALRAVAADRDAKDALVMDLMRTCSGQLDLIESLRGLLRDLDNEDRLVCANASEGRPPGQCDCVGCAARAALGRDAT